MTVSEFLYKHLNTVENTVPLNAPIETPTPFITYSIDSQEVTKSISGLAYTENFVTVTVYADEYDVSEEISQRVQIALGCIAEQNIMGATFQGKSNSNDSEPVDRYSVALEYSVYERS